jgi:hypothetical protein
MALGKCKDCEYWDRIDPEKGICQRYPPVPFDTGAQAKQPETDENLECGEFLQET